MSFSDQIQALFTNSDAQQKLRELEIILVFFHGSRAKGREHEASDYDFAVLLDDRVEWTYLDGIERLDKFGEMMADMLRVSRDLIDVQDLHDMPVSIAFHVVGDGALLWEGEPALGVSFRRQTYSLYQDFEYTESIFRKALRRQLLGDKKVG